MQKTQDETTMISAEQQEAVEERQLRRRAKWLLKNFRKFLEQKHKQEEEMRNTPLFTRDDALYVLSGMAAHKGGERVQTSNLSNAPETATMNVDETLERMNRQVRADVAKGYDQLCERINMVNIVLSLLAEPERSAARQIYVEGKGWKNIISSDGQYFNRGALQKIRNRTEECMMDVLRNRDCLSYERDEVFHE